MTFGTKAIMRCNRSRTSNNTAMRTAERAKIAFVQARSYTDDGRLQHGALSFPTRIERPGSRDDETSGPHGTILTVL